MATATIPRSPFIEALRVVVRALPFNDNDRTVLMAAIETCAHSSRCEVQR